LPHGRSILQTFKIRAERLKRKGKDDDSKSSNTDGDGEGDTEVERVLKESEGRPDTEDKPITEADIKVEIKDGRRTPVHARDMPPVSCNQKFK